MLTTGNVGHHTSAHPSLTTVLYEQPLGLSVAKWKQDCKISWWNSW